MKRLIELKGTYSYRHGKYFVENHIYYDTELMSFIALEYLIPRLYYVFTFGKIRCAKDYDN